MKQITELPQYQITTISKKINKTHVTRDWRDCETSLANVNINKMQMTKLLARNEARNNIGQQNKFT